MKTLPGQFEQKEKVRGLAPSDIKLYYKDIVFKTMCCCSKNRLTH